MNWPWKMIWKTKASLKLLTWKVAAKGACLTNLKLQRRGFSLCRRRFFYENSLESISYLFLHCNQVGQIWSLFLQQIWRVLGHAMGSE